MEEILCRLSECVIRGKIDTACPHPQEMAAHRYHLSLHKKLALIATECLNLTILLRH